MCHSLTFDPCQIGYVSSKTCVCGSSTFRYYGIVSYARADEALKAYKSLNGHTLTLSLLGHTRTTLQAMSLMGLTPLSDSDMALQTSGAANKMAEGTAASQTMEETASDGIHPVKVIEVCTAKELDPKKDENAAAKKKFLESIFDNDSNKEELSQAGAVSKKPVSKSDVTQEPSTGQQITGSTSNVSSVSDPEQHRSAPQLGEPDQSVRPSVLNIMDMAVEENAAAKEYLHSLFDDDSDKEEPSQAGAVSMKPVPKSGVTQELSTGQQITGSMPNIPSVPYPGEHRSAPQLGDPDQRVTRSVLNIMDMDIELGGEPIMEPSPCMQMDEAGAPTKTDLPGSAGSQSEEKRESSMGNLARDGLVGAPRQTTRENAKDLSQRTQDAVKTEAVAGHAAASGGDSGGRGNKGGKKTKKGRRMTKGFFLQLKISTLSFPCFHTQSEYGPVLF